MKMKIVVDEDEAYPVFYPRIAKANDKYVREIPDEKWEWIKKVTKEYERVQEYLKKSNLE
jgi:hypothetical protein